MNIRRSIRSEHLLIPLCLGVALAGSTRTLDGWPFVCYPTFHQKISRQMPLMSVVVRDAHGRERRVDHRRFLRPNNHSWGKNWRLAGFYSKVDINALHAFGRKKIAPLLNDDDKEVLFFRSSIDVQSAEVKDRRLLLRWGVHSAPR